MIHHSLGELHPFLVAANVEGVVDILDVQQTVEQAGFADAGKEYQADRTRAGEEKAERIGLIVFSY